MQSKVCKDCTERAVHCRETCERWKKEKAERDKLNAKIRKEKLLHGAFVEMQKAKGKRR